MKFRLISFFILGFFLFHSLTYTHAVKRTVAMEYEEDADSVRKNNADSAREARTRIADSMKDARARIMDSTKLARRHATDSMQKARKHITDSTASIRKYHDSKHYKDSVTRARTAKTNSLQKARQAHMDSLKDARKQQTDALTASRKAKTDSVKAVQKKRSDSLAKIKKYKTSKRYADSVAIVRHNHLDSIQTAQKASRDRMASIRKHSLDSTNKARKHSMDSLKTVRTKHMDSLKLLRKQHTDSLAKAKKAKEELAKAKEKKKEESMKLKLEIKMKQKHEAWSNKSMLKKRWSPLRRFTQNSFTHYNYYYNAKKKMDEALVNMQRSRKENYDSLIGLYPFDPNRDSTLLSSDMDTIVRKISIGIQIHDPRVKWSNDLYLLLGEAYYYRGRYDNASTAFRYIISKDEEKKKKEAAKNGYGKYSSSKEEPSIMEEEKRSRLAFLKHKSVHNEAVLWLARTYTEAHEAENAESVLSLLDSDPNFPNDLKGRLAIEKAFAYLQEHNDRQASNQLSVAIDDDNLPYWLRMRAAFLNGQLLQNMGDHKEAAESFERVLTYYPKVEMDFYSRKYIAYNRLESGENVDAATRPLKRVLNDGKYVNFYDQVYYVLGSVAVKGNDNEKAITYFTKSTTTPKASKKQKALSFVALGDVYYSTANYPAAKRAYDSASKYSTAASKDKGVIAAMQKNKGLEEISGPAKVIRDQDSLMALSALSKKEQLSAVRRYLRLLEQRQEDSSRNASVMAASPSVPAEADDNPEAANWYFGNALLMQQGSTDFKRKWGNRALTDNWQRAAAVSLASGAGSGDEEDGEAAEKENGLPTEESLLAKIPNTPQQKELSAKIEQRAYILMAKAYYKQLEDYKQSSLTLDTLDMRFPNHNQKEEELYLRYQIALKQGQLAKAQQYSQELLSKYPESEYAGILRPRKSESKAEKNTTGMTVQAYFDETYNLVMQHQYTEALMHVNVAKRQFDNPAYAKRFEVTEAMAYAGTGDYTMADSVIRKFLHSYPSDTLTAWATSVKDYIKDMRTGGKPSWYNETIADLARADSANKLKPVKPTAAVDNKPKVSPAVPPAEIPSKYSYQADSGHYCIIVLPGLDSKTSGLKKAIRDLNGGKYSSSGLNVLLDLYNLDLGVLVVQKFANAADAKGYMNDLLASDAMNGYAPGELKVLVITANNYKKMFADKDTQPYYSFYNAYYK